jgi:hypothetical protein
MGIPLSVIVDDLDWRNTSSAQRRLNFSVPVDELADLRDRLHRFTVLAGPTAPSGLVEA